MKITKKEIAEILELHGLEVRLWEVDQNVFEGAIVDGYKSDGLTQQVVEDGQADSDPECNCKNPRWPLGKCLTCGGWPPAA